MHEVTPVTVSDWWPCVEGDNKIQQPCVQALFRRLSCRSRSQRTWGQHLQLTTGRYASSPGHRGYCYAGLAALC